MEEQTISKGSSSIIVPALVSGVVSAGLALLLAPKSGQEIRQDIGRVVKKSGEQSSEAFEEIRAGISQAAGSGREALAAAKEELGGPAAITAEKTSLIVPILVSGIVGAALALLFAPKAGKEVMKDFKGYASTAVDKGKGLYEQGVNAVKEAFEKGREAAAVSKEKLRPAA
jgi:gas vesicle protein